MFKTALTDLAGFGHLNFENLKIVSDFDPPASPCSHGGQVFGFRIWVRMPPILTEITQWLSLLPRGIFSPMSTLLRFQNLLNTILFAKKDS
jgi:hypothetical protein